MGHEYILPHSFVIPRNSTIRRYMCRNNAVGRTLLNTPRVCMYVRDIRGKDWSHPGGQNRPEGGKTNLIGCF
jgi:hypothetical protein